MHAIVSPPDSFSGYSYSVYYSSGVFNAMGYSVAKGLIKSIFIPLFCMFDIWIGTAICNEPINCFRLTVNTQQHILFTYRQTLRHKLAKKSVLFTLFLVKVNVEQN